MPVVSGSCRSISTTSGAFAGNAARAAAPFAHVQTQRRSPLASINSFRRERNGAESSTMATVIVPPRFESEVVRGVWEVRRPTLSVAESEVVLGMSGGGKVEDDGID